MRLGHIELFVREPLKARDFYRDVLGFEEVVVQGETFVWMKSGNTEVLLRPGSGPSGTSIYSGAPSGIVLYTDDLDRTAEALRSRGLQFQGNDGSDRCLTFTDLDGHWFQLVNPDDH